MPPFLRRVLIGAVLTFTAVSLAGCDAAPALVDTERAVELHVRGLDARIARDFETADELLEEACLLRHEPSCQAVWLQLDLGSEQADEETLSRLEGTARRLADSSGGTWFGHSGREGHLVRVYCPVEREADLRGALQRLRVPLGG
jgi:hypothetical protein